MMYAAGVLAVIVIEVYLSTHPSHKVRKSSISGDGVYLSEYGASEAIRLLLFCLLWPVVLFVLVPIAFSFIGINKLIISLEDWRRRGE